VVIFGAEGEWDDDLIQVACTNLMVWCCCVVDTMGSGHSQCVITRHIYG
jgi:hypothetical protein